jgi:GTP-binding protein Era
MSTRCGYVAIIGRPNAGKSTLFNRLVGQKISSVSYKPQTTRHRILGVRTETDSQFVYVDTPGIHLGGKKLLNRVLNKNATNALYDVHLIYMLVDGGSWTREEDHILRQLQQVECPVILVLNKIDKLKQREQLFELLSRSSERYDFAEIVPISALKRDNIDSLVNVSKQYLPESEFFYNEEYLTDRSTNFICAELIREAAFVFLDKELPYATHVEIEKFDSEQTPVHISAVIWVEKDSQKSILIGKKGDMLKKIGTRSRLSMERQLGFKAHLEIWVKLKKDWQDNPQVVGQYEK